MFIIKNFLGVRRFKVRETATFELSGKFTISKRQ